MMWPRMAYVFILNETTSKIRRPRPTEVLLDMCLVWPRAHSETTWRLATPRKATIAQTFNGCYENEGTTMETFRETMRKALPSPLPTYLSSYSSCISFSSDEDASSIRIEFSILPSVLERNDHRHFFVVVGSDVLVGLYSQLLGLSYPGSCRGQGRHD